MQSNNCGMRMYVVGNLDLQKKCESYLFQFEILACLPRVKTEQHAYKKRAITRAHVHPASRARNVKK